MYVQIHANQLLMRTLQSPGCMLIFLDASVAALCRWRCTAVSALRAHAVLHRPGLSPWPRAPCSVSSGNGRISPKQQHICLNDQFAAPCSDNQQSDGVETIIMASRLDAAAHGSKDAHCYRDCFDHQLTRAAIWKFEISRLPEDHSSRSPCHHMALACRMRIVR
jgi:hypothetical protein